MTTTVATLPAPYRAISTRAVARAELTDLMLLAAHVPIALLLHLVPGLAVVHSVSVLVLGLLWSTSARTVHRTVFAAAYIAGAEILWRMTDGNLIYEYGKYAVTLLMVAAIHRLAGWRRPKWLSVVYLILLVPSIQLTLEQLGGFFAARRDLSFNLSGPIALGFCVLFFSGIDYDRIHLRRLLVVMLAPIAGITTIAGRSTLTAETIDFGGESNFVTSGGFGPNQVSAILGLGAVIGILLATQTRDRRWRWCLFALAAVQLLQATLTFSRGGVLNALICLAILAVHYLPRPRVRLILLSALLFFGVVGVKVVLPAVDRWTGGALGERYTDLNASIRQNLIAKELALFRENPALGVGPGMAKYRRSERARIQVAAHTEYSRMLAEHGLLGAAALAIMILLAVWAYLRAPTAITRAWVAVMVAWPMLEMLHAAMRITAISFLFGLAMIRWRIPRAPGGGRGSP